MRLSRGFRKAARVSSDLEAVRRGRVLPRARNRLVGRMLGKATRGLFR